MSDYEEMLSQVADLADRAFEQLAKTAEKWQGDSADDVLARGMIGTVAPLITSFQEACRLVTEDEDAPNMIMLALAVRHFNNTAGIMAGLDQITALRERDE